MVCDSSPKQKPQLFLVNARLVSSGFAADADPRLLLLQGCSPLQEERMPLQDLIGATQLTEAGRLCATIQGESPAAAAAPEPLPWPPAAQQQQECFQCPRVTQSTDAGRQGPQGTVLVPLLDAPAHRALHACFHCGIGASATSWLLLLLQRCSFLQDELAASQSMIGTT